MALFNRTISFLCSDSQNVAVALCPNAVIGHPYERAKVDSR